MLSHPFTCLKSKRPPSAAFSKTLVMPPVFEVPKMATRTTEINITLPWTTSVQTTALIPPSIV